MCNRYANRVGYRRLIDEFSDTRIPLLSPKPEAAPNLEPRNNIHPTDQALSLLPITGGLELRELRWGLIPWFHKWGVKDWKPLTTNARSETIETTATFKSAFAERRCLIPLSFFYEWTGEKGHKTKWRFSMPGQDMFCFAGIWDHAKTADGPIDSFALVTRAPGPEFAKYHDRQPVILSPADYEPWLDSPASAKALFRAAPIRLDVALADT